MEQTGTVPLVIASAFLVGVGVAGLGGGVKPFHIPHSPWGRRSAPYARPPVPRPSLVVDRRALTSLASGPVAARASVPSRPRVAREREGYRDCANTHSRSSGLPYAAPQTQWASGWKNVPFGTSV